MDRTGLLLQSIDKFYKNEKNADVLSDILESKNNISLRTIEWFITNYSKKKNVTYQSGDSQFSVHLAYKSSLSGYSKKLFDPFCRTKRMMYDIPGHGKIETTVAQLNFLRWCIQHDIINYIDKNNIKPVKK